MSTPPTPTPTPRYPSTANIYSYAQKRYVTRVVRNVRPAASNLYYLQGTIKLDNRIITVVLAHPTDTSFHWRYV